MRSSSNLLHAVSAAPWSSKAVAALRLKRAACSVAAIARARASLTLNLEFLISPEFHSQRQNIKWGRGKQHP